MSTPGPMNANPSSGSAALLAAERRCTDLEFVEEGDLFEEELYMLALWYELKKLRSICSRPLDRAVEKAKAEGLKGERAETEVNTKIRDGEDGAAPPRGA